MAHNRLERIGTIYTRKQAFMKALESKPDVPLCIRVTGLIQSGAMSLNDRPLWYKVYQTFPPSTPAQYDNPAPKGDIRKIFYPEDVIRAKFYSKFSSSVATNLEENNIATPCQKFVQKCREVSISKGVQIDQVFDEVFTSFKEEFLANSKAGENHMESKSVKPPRQKNILLKTSVEMDSVLSIGENDSQSKLS